MKTTHQQKRKMCTKFFLLHIQKSITYSAVILIIMKESITQQLMVITQ